jgi:signal transduction histidine kinase
VASQSLFEVVLASTVHDIKNSLSLLLGQLEYISSKLENDPESQQSISSLRYETSRTNLSLMQLLSLYKLENDQLDVQVIEVDVYEFIEDCLATHASVACEKKVELVIDCDGFLLWFFDPELVGIAINNLIGNSINYAKSKISISAGVVDGLLTLAVNDDGDGYPEEMLHDPENFVKRVNHRTGSTGLGLFFSAIIASEHKRGERQGEISLDNDSPLSGGRFKIMLP